MNNNKAKRAKILLGTIELEVFQLLNKTYVLSQTQVASIVGRNEQYIRKFLQSKWLKDLLGESFKTVKSKISTEGKGNKISVVSPEIAFAFWQKESESGNVLARRLVFACGVETIERRADKVFNNKRTEQEYNDQLASRILSAADPYQVLFEKELCEKGFKWYGSNFYWTYFYFWMTPEERCELEQSNPLINGVRKYKIHQWIEGETKERLKVKARELAILILRSNCKQSFETTFAEWYGGCWQQTIF